MRIYPPVDYVIDDTLSFGARGFLAYILRARTPIDVEGVSRDGEDIAGFVGELQRAGYIRENGLHDSKPAKAGETVAKKPAAPKGQACSIPANFKITRPMRDWFGEQHFNFDLDMATEQWIDAMRSNQAKYRYTNWASAWRNGMRQYQKWNPDSVKPNGADLQDHIHEFFKR